MQTRRSPLATTLQKCLFASASSPKLGASSTRSWPGPCARTTLLLLRIHVFNSPGSPVSNTRMKTPLSSSAKRFRPTCESPLRSTPGDACSSPPSSPQAADVSTTPLDWLARRARRVSASVDPPLWTGIYAQPFETLEQQLGRQRYMSAYGEGAGHVVRRRNRTPTERSRVTPSTATDLRTQTELSP